MFLPGGGGGNLPKRNRASSRLSGTCKTGSLDPVSNLVRLEATDRGTPPPLIDLTCLRDGVMAASGERITDSGVLGESWGAVVARVMRW